MRKNVASQVISAHLISKTDGSDVTSGTTTVYVTGNGGAQASSGSATHEGNGEWSYLPTQAETNYDQIAFTFVNTSAVSVTLNVYTIGQDPTAAVFAANTTQWLGGTIPSVNVTGVPLVDLKYTLGTISPATAGSVRADSVTGAVGSVTAGVTVTTNNDKTGYGLSSAAVQAIWDAATSALSTVGSIGKWIVDKIDVVLSTRLATSGYTAPLDAAGTRTAVGLASANLDTQLTAIDDYLDTEVAAIKAKTDQLTFTVANVLDANALSVGGTVQTAGDIAALINALALYTTRIVARCTVGSASSTTSIVTSACSPSGAAADQFKGRIVVFDAATTTAALRGQATDITASSNSATPTLTVTALTTAPASGDTFSIA